METEQEQGLSSGYLWTEPMCIRHRRVLRALEYYQDWGGGTYVLRCAVGCSYTYFDTLPEH